MPIMPTLTSFWNCRAAPPSLVKIAVPLPYGLSLISCHAFLVAVDPNHRQHRPEDLVGVDAHVGRDVIKQRRADEEPVAVARRPSARARPTTSVAPAASPASM